MEEIKSSVVCTNNAVNPHEKRGTRVISIVAPIGTGKTSLSTMVGSTFGIPVFYEPVNKDVNPLLELFYKDQKRYSFPLQVFFLNQRFDMIKKALYDGQAVLDSSIYSDKVMYTNILELGNTTQEEYDLYCTLLENMLDETRNLPSKAPDLTIFIKTSFDTMIKRIQKRGRPFEQFEADPTLYGYYKNLHRLYQEHFDNFNLTPKLIIDGDRYDFVNSETDKECVLRMIALKMDEINLGGENK